MEKQLRTFVTSALNAHRHNHTKGKANPKANIQNGDVYIHTVS